MPSRINFSACGKLMHVTRDFCLNRNAVDSFQLGHKVLLKACETASLADGKEADGPTGRAPGGANSRSQQQPSLLE